MSVISDNPGEHLYELAKLQGVATATVSDGTVILIDIAFMKRWIAENPEAPTLLIHSKRPDASS